MTITITGDNTFLRTYELQQLTENFLKEHDDDSMAIERIDGEEVSVQRLSESINGFSLFSTDKLVIVRSPSGQKAFMESAETILSAVPETTQVVLLEPKLDKRTSYYKYLKKNTKFVQCDSLDSRQLTSWITEVVEQSQGKISRSDAQYLVDRIGSDQQLLFNEVQKLLAFNSHITKVSIEALTDLSPQGTVFELLDAAFAGKTQQALALYHAQRQQKVEPLAIVGMLAWQMHVVAIVQAGKNHDDGIIAKDAGINPFVVRKSRSVARRLTRSQLKKLIQQLLQLDIDLKSKNINADDAVSQFVLELSETAIS